MEKKRKYYKGKFRPDQPDKYKGNTRNIIYRSMWERRFMIYLDRNENIIEWGSEELSIPYKSPVDGKIHRYYVDIYIPSQQRCIEVKSTWSFELNPEIVFTKQRALQDAGYSCEICVLNKKGVLLDKYM